mmetsp:Transcript_1750/g.3893  ORF Transcript_1750/g.3893 Transcript_1750/m.3893 type:complete len:162 (-) Transcript_1750:538-1023(-)|eukprot:CAMPEP_0206459448 /NCGR_PEP_ID=MMETSP0324_2-20121206/24177_1 /ASSEMBLY_ACC=CAM_ASM_000836 /TAXON_ID=2866 /ORGANISM="Crypthecodinium cohnii, Strain Seligo" /LENGTH=161 /DNA_ID=CAMNT_0053930991 /DNA_START=208 /DNA_END=693 /DNA_ORIENTATION=+
MSSSSSSPARSFRGEDERFSRPLRSKGLLPAIGVGAAVYFITGFASLSTLGLVGVGAGVGYTVGSWVADKFGSKDGPPGGVPIDQLPWAVQVALKQWQDFLIRRSAGRQLTQADVDSIWSDFERAEPTHANNARQLVRGGVGSEARQPGQPSVVPIRAAEV